ncbi:MAG: hypothetical protein OEQ53_04815 [Saprospiraceae bacterium]|nr:hypothetical protein [Saprospiraceae bacterium]
MKKLLLITIVSVGLQSAVGQNLQSQKIKSWYWSPNTVVTCQNDQDVIKLAPFLHKDRETKKRFKQVQINEKDLQLVRSRGSWNMTNVAGKLLVHSSNRGHIVQTPNGRYFRKQPFLFNKAVEYVTKDGDLIVRGEFRRRSLTLEGHDENLDSHLLMAMAMNELLELAKDEALTATTFVGVACD